MSKESFIPWLVVCTHWDRRKESIKRFESQIKNCTSLLNLGLVEHSTHCCTYLGGGVWTSGTHYVASQRAVRLHHPISYRYCRRDNWNIEQPPGSLSSPTLESRRLAGLYKASKFPRALARGKHHRGRCLKVENFHNLIKYSLFFVSCFMKWKKIKTI